jgi:hypothetical protein
MMTYSGAHVSRPCIRQFTNLLAPPSLQVESAKWIPLKEASMTVNCRRGVSRLSLSSQQAKKETSNETKEIIDTEQGYGTP